MAAIFTGEQPRRVGADPRGKGREGGEMIVDRRRRQTRIDEVLLPGDDVAPEAGTDTLVAVGLLIEGDEPPELQGDFLRNFLGADTGDRELLVAFGPDREAVNRYWHKVRNDPDKPGITFVK